MEEPSASAVAVEEAAAAEGHVAGALKLATAAAAGEALAAGELGLAAELGLTVMSAPRVEVSAGGVGPWRTNLRGEGRSRN